MASFSTAASKAAHAISAALVDALHSDAPPPIEPLRRLLIAARDNHLGLPAGPEHADDHHLSVRILQSLLDRLDHLAAQDGCSEGAIAEVRR